MADEELSAALEEGLTDPEGADEGSDKRVGALITTVGLALIILWLILNSGIVPNTVGMSSEQSKSVLREAGFASEVTTQAAGMRPSNRVIRQSPSGGLRLRLWPIQVTITAGGDGSSTSGNGNGGYPYRDYSYDVDTDGDKRTMPVDAEEMKPLYVPPSTELLMPNVQNMTSTKAQRKIKALGLRVTRKYGPSTTDVAKNRVYYQYPAPGTRVKRGDVTLVWVSTGPMNINVQLAYPAADYPGPERPGF